MGERDGQRESEARRSWERKRHEERLGEGESGRKRERGRHVRKGVGKEGREMKTEGGRYKIGGRQKEVE